MNTIIGLAMLANVNSTPVPPPNTIEVGKPYYEPIAQIETIKPAEILPLEEMKPVIIETPPEPVQTATKVAVKSISRASTGGNTYTPGNCTWYAKSRRPDLPNGLGNANTWYVRAIAQGIPGGLEARPGAIAVSTKGTYGHVVYVDSVDGEMMTITEMNYRELYGITTRTIPSAGWSFIY